VLDGKDEDETSFPTHDDYEDMFQSVDVEDPTSLLVYDANDEGGSSVLPPNYDMGSTPHPIYDMYDDACVEDDNKGVDWVYEDSPHESYHCTISYSESIISLHDLENELLVTEEKIV
jgi:hypothetical protein